MGTRVLKPVLDPDVLMRYVGDRVVVKHTEDGQLVTSFGVLDKVLPAREWLRPRVIEGTDITELVLTQLPPALVVEAAGYPSHPIALDYVSRVVIHS